MTRSSLHNIGHTYRSVIQALKSSKDDCKYSEVDEVTQVVLDLVRKSPDIDQLKTMKKILDRQVEVLSRTPTPIKLDSTSNLSRLADKVNEILHVDGPHALANLFLKEADVKEFKKIIKKISDEEILLEVGKICIKMDPEKTAKNLNLFKLKGNPDALMEMVLHSVKPGLIPYFKKEGLEDPSRLYLVALKFAAINTKELIENLQEFEIKDLSLLKNIALFCASHDGEMTASKMDSFSFDTETKIELFKECAKESGIVVRYIDRFEIENLKDRVEIAKLCAEKNGLETTKNIAKFKIDPSLKEGQTALFEIAQLAAEQNYEVVKYIEKFQLQNEDDRNSIAKICCKKNAGLVAENIEKIDIQDSDKRFEMAKLIAKKQGDFLAKYFKNFKIDSLEQKKILARLSTINSGKAAEYIQNFDITDEKVLFELAKNCAEQDGNAFALHLKNFQIKDLDKLYELALICAKGKSIEFIEKLDQFKIGSEEKRFELAMLSAKSSELSAQMIASRFPLFKIQDENHRILLLKECARGNGKIIHSVHKFGFDFTKEKWQELLVEVTLLCAKSAPHAVSIFMGQNLIKGYKDKGEYEVKLEILKACAQRDVGSALECFKSFGFDDEHSSLFIANLAAQYDPYSLCSNIDQLNIPSEVNRLVLAYACAKKEGSYLAYKIDQFNITDPKELLNLAHVCVESGWSVKKAELASFQIKDEETILKLLETAILKGNIVDFSSIREFDLPEEEENRLYMLTYTSNFLHHSLDNEGTKILEQRILPQIKSELALDLDAQKLNLSSNNPKELCLAYLMLKSLGFYVEDERSSQALEKIVKYRNGLVALSLGLNLLKLQKSENHRIYYNLLEAEASFNFLSYKILPVLFISKWGSEGADEKLIKTVKRNLESPTLKKGFSESGSSIEKTWLRTCQILDEAKYIEPELKTRLLSLATTYLNPKKEKENLIKRLNSIQAIVYSKRIDLIENYMSILENKVLAFQKEKGDTFPYFKEIEEKQLEVASLKRKEEELEKTIKGVKESIVEQTTEVKALQELKTQYETTKSEKSESIENLEEKLEFLTPLDEVNKAADKAVIERLKEIKLAYLERISELKNEVKDLDTKLKAIDESLSNLSKVMKSKEESFLGDSTQELKMIKKELSKENSVLVKLERSSKKSYQKSKDKKILEEKETSLAKEITNTFSKGIQEILKEDPFLDLSKVENLDQKYLDTFDKMRVPNGWKAFELGIEKLADPDVQKSFQDFMVSVLNGTFKEERYALNSKHNQVIAQNYPEVWEKWQSVCADETVVGVNNKKYNVCNTDEWQNLFLAGTDVDGSCQHILGNPEMNKCLLGFTNDGKNRMIAIQNSAGKTVARSLFRILWNDFHKKPVLFLEGTYPFSCSSSMREKILDFAQKEAKRLQLTLCIDDLGKRFEEKNFKKNDDVLISYEGRAAFDYSDAGGGNALRGAFTINKGYIAHQEE